MKFYSQVVKLLFLFAALNVPQVQAFEIFKRLPDRSERKEVVTLTKDNTISLNGEVTQESMSKLIKQARDLDTRIPSGDPLYLVLNTPGGDILAGMEAIVNLKSLHRKVHTITVRAYSMGFQMVQGLSDRLVLETGELMSHKARGAFQGEFPGQLDSRYAHALEKIQVLDEQTVKRTQGKHTLDSYRSLIQYEYWGDGQKNINQGFADRVIIAQCDKSLEGTHPEVLEKAYFLGKTIEIRVVRDNCPLNTGALDYEVFVDGRNLYPEVVTKTDLKGQQSAIPASSNVYGPVTLSASDSLYMNYSQTLYPNSGTSLNSITSNISRDEMLMIKEKVDSILDRSKHPKVVYSY